MSPAGDLDRLFAEWRRPLYGFVYKMTAAREDADDLVQEVYVRAVEGAARFRGESKFETWLFGIAAHVCLDHLRKRKRWSADAQLKGEQEAESDPGRLAEVQAMLARPDVRFEIREHIAFCFTCIGRTLDPEGQAAVMLREVLGFANQECALILGVSEPVFRHRLSAARAEMTGIYEGLCALINKNGVCHQCRGLRELAPEANRGPDLVRIEVAPGVAVTPDSLFDARVAIVREADLENGRTRVVHDCFFGGVGRREEGERRV